MKLKTKTRTSAFTLVELLLVLVILGVLAAIVVPRFSGRTEQAKRQAAQTQISTFKTALNLYELDMGRYPAKLEDLIVRPRDAQNWRKYLETDRIPLDPWGSEYMYKYPGTHNPDSYDLSSAGPPGENSPVTNWTIDNK